VIGFLISLGNLLRKKSKNTTISGQELAVEEMDDVS
jgi:hypothetical protein